MKKAAAIIAAVVLVAALGFLYFKVKEFSGTDHEGFQKALWRLKQLDTAFNEDVLEARFALLDNYDDFQANEVELKRLVEILGTPPASFEKSGRAAIESARAQFATLSTNRQILFERFKSQNAMLANSRRYLPMALGELSARLGPEDRQLEQIVSDVTRLALTRLSSPDELPPDASARLKQLADWGATHRDHREARFVASLGRHLQVVITGNGEVDALTRRLLALPTAASIEGIFHAYESEVTKALQRAQHYRLFLYVVCFVLVAGVGYMLWALRRANARLEQRVEERTRDLAGSEERFRTLSVASPIGIYMTGSDGKCMYANPAFQEIFGLTEKECTAGGCAKILHEADREGVLADWTAATKEGKPFAREFRLQPPGADVRWVSSRAAAVRTSDGKVLGFVGTLENISERKRAEAELAAAHKKLIETSRQAGMAEVATGVLHNVGNVLNSVNVSATLVADTLAKSKSANLTRVATLVQEHVADLANFLTTDPKGKQLPDYLGRLAMHLADEQAGLLKETEQVRKNIEHIKDIVAMQQSYAKVSGVTESIKATELVEDALRLNAASLTRHDVQVVRRFEADATLNVDKHKVLQILINLIRNAKHACDDSGREDKQLTLCIANGGGTVKISVLDNGVGIPGENLTRIFNHGFTTKKDGHGFGLHSGALAAKELGGALHAHSDGPGHGAAFTLELPCKSF